MSYVCTLMRGQMSNTVNQFGGRYPHTSFFKGGQMSGGGGGDEMHYHYTLPLPHLCWLMTSKLRNAFMLVEPSVLDAFA